MVIAQFPNTALFVFLGAAMLAWLISSGFWHNALRVTMYAALFVWATDEVVRGVNPFRRLLGAAVAGVTAAGLLLR